MNLRPLFFVVGNEQMPSARILTFPKPCGNIYHMKSKILSLLACLIVGMTSACITTEIPVDDPTDPTNPNSPLHPSQQKQSLPDYRTIPQK